MDSKINKYFLLITLSLAVMQFLYGNGTQKETKYPDKIGLHTDILGKGDLSCEGKNIFSASTVAIGNVPESQVYEGSGLVPSMPKGPEQWTAHWITAPDAISGENMMLLARRSFNLLDIPERAVMFITADTRYQLYVNGVSVHRGPARCASHHQSYDALDIRQFLIEGTNVLAVRIHHTGLGLSYYQTTRCGLLAQLEMDGAGDRSVIVTDRQWKMMRDPSWNSASPRINRWHDGFVDWADLRNFDDKWVFSTFDDTKWPNAFSVLPDKIRSSDDSKPIPYQLSAWWPESQSDYLPQAISPPWLSLVPRDVPFLKETLMDANRIVAAGQMKKGIPLPPLAEVSVKTKDQYHYGRGADGSMPLILPPSESGKSTFVVFDLGEVHNGYPRLDIKGPEGTVLDIFYAPYLVEGRLDPTILFSQHKDQLILSGKNNQWESFFFKPFRYMAIIANEAEAPVEVNFAGLTSIKYPWQGNGLLELPDNKWLNDFWHAGVKTIDVITTDAYTDNYRERRQYAQTSYYAARGNYAVFGDTYLHRRLLLQISQEQLPNGDIPAFAPIHSGSFMPFLDAWFFWVMSWRDYLLFSGDDVTTRHLFDNARNIMARLEEIAGKDGLLKNPPVPYWIDHANLDRRGESFIINALYAITLDHYADVLEWLDEPGHNNYRGQAANLRLKLRERFWDGERGLFVDAIVNGNQSGRFSEHGNGIALASDIASPQQVPLIVSELLKPGKDLVQTTSLFIYWTFVGLCRNGYVDEGLAMLENKFQHQLHEGNGTLWEEWNLNRTYRSGVAQKTTRADAQGEPAVFPMALMEWCAGIEIASPGFKTVLIRRRKHSLGNVRANLPTPLGEVIVKWEDRKGKQFLETRVPEGIEARLDLKSMQILKGATLWMDGKKLKGSSLKGEWLALPTGTHLLELR